MERTVSTGDMDKFQEAICAFANDMANSRKPGYLLIGVHDDGRLSNLKVDDRLFIKISAIRSSGNILPLPVMTVECFEFDDGDVLVVEVQPSLYPPVRYRGRTFIRIGPRRDIAGEAEERILVERRSAYMPTFDTSPCFHAKLDDLNIEKFLDVYLPKAVSATELDDDGRSLKEKMAAVGMYDLENDCPTFGAIALFGNNPRRFMPGLYTQFVRFKGLDKTSEVDDERQFEGGYFEALPKLEAFLEMSVVRQRPVPVSVLREEMVFNYPYWALRELLLNAYMHRDMQGNAPIRLYEFEDRIELMNPGGLYGNARPENFPRVNDYRNPLVAAAFKAMGYVNMFNRGVGEVQRQLKENGGSPAVFNVGNLTAFEVTVYRRAAGVSARPDVPGHEKGVKSGVLSQPEGIKSEVLSQSERHQVGRRLDGQSIIERRILDFCSRPRSLKEISGYLGIKAFQKVKSRYINNLLQNGRLLMTVPDKPTSRLQKYVISDFEKHDFPLSHNTP